MATATRRTIVVAPRRAPSNVSITLPRAAARGLARGARAGGRAALMAAQAEKHTLAAVGAAAVLGYMSRDGAPQVPHIAAIGVPGTYGVALWAVGRMTKSRTASHLATGLLSIAAYDLARTSALGGAAGGAPAGGGGAAMRGVL